MASITSGSFNQPISPSQPFKLKPPFHFPLSLPPFTTTPFTFLIIIIGGSKFQKEAGVNRFQVGFEALLFAIAFAFIIHAPLTVAFTFAAPLFAFAFIFHLSHSNPVGKLRRQVYAFFFISLFFYFLTSPSLHHIVTPPPVVSRSP